MDDIIKLDAHRPHITIKARDGVHVVPAIYFEKIIAGKEILEIDINNEDMFVAIITDWYNSLMFD